MTNKAYILITVLGLCLCGCNGKQEQTPTVQITVKALSETSSKVTRGYVTGTGLEYIRPEDLHSAAESKVRSLILSAHLQSSGTSGETYFQNAVFTKNDTRDVWSHEPLYMWPIKGTLDFIAYSCDAPFDKSDVLYDGDNVSAKMKIRIGSDRTQDDVLFSVATNCTDESTGGTVPMLFKHAQAWLEFIINCEAGFEKKIIFHGLTLKDAYTDGTLTVERPYGYAQGEWSFRESTAADYDVDDTFMISGDTLTTAPGYMDMLIPEQEQCDIMVHYQYVGSPLLLDYRMEMPTATWEMGKKYIYEISFAPRGITIKPSIIDWETQAPIDIKL